MDIYAEGSNLIYGRLGQLLLITTFIAAIASFLSYYLSVKNIATADRSASWQKTGRNWFIIHGMSAIGAGLLLLIMMQQHIFEYKYVYQHTSRELSPRFLLAALWEGQEGSTLLWLFWQSILGFVLMFRAKKWESPVMAILALSQVMLASMELGVHIKVPDFDFDFSPFYLALNWVDYRVGSNPFILVKDAMNLPIFSMDPTYVFEDGNGLNPLLQNYWMTIHPPTLFLGYATTTIPFAYVFSSLWLRNYKDWITPTIRWTLFSLFIMGSGIIMGGAWAYETLSFGGFWAWDPVENASLVPWLFLAAGLHTAVAYKSTRFSMIPTYIFMMAGMLMSLYSSFLTKGGVLGESSVHSFTDMGMSAQLVISILIFLIPAVWLFITRYKELPARKDEEDVSSREFWMFIGALVFLISALHISVFTSFPVFNKVFGSNIAPPDAAHYNRVEIWIAAMLAIGTAITQFFAYKKSNLKIVCRNIILSLGISLLVVAPFLYYFKLYRVDFFFLAVTSMYAIVGNAFYLIKMQKAKILRAGGSITHIGFGIFMFGVLISQGRQHVVSINQYGLNYGDNFTEQENAENILLYKDEPQMMSGYRVTYLGDSTAMPNIYFKVKYEKLDKKGHIEKSFVLTPDVQINKKMGNVANPSTHKNFFKDLYTHITTAPLNEDGTPSDTISTELHKIGISDTIFTSRSFAIFEGLDPKATTDKIELKPNDILIGAKLRFYTVDTNYVIEPKYFIRDMVASSIPVDIKDPEVKFSFTRIYPQEEQVQVEITTEQKLRKFIIMKAIIFPFMDMVWLGIFVMVAGIIISLRKRILEKG